MRDINLLLRPSHSRAATLLLAAVFAILAGGCRHEPPIAVHYLPGFVPGSEHLFHPAAIAVAPVGGALAQGSVRVGAIYAADGTEYHALYVDNFGRPATDALMRALGDAGLKPVAIAAAPSSANDFPAGTDFMLSASIAKISVIKHFGQRMTVHGRYFTMKSEVVLNFALSSRAGANLYSGTISGTEDEPPIPVGGEEFLPLETDPAESLSVALSRAVGRLMIEPGFQHQLPMIAASASTPAPSPSAAASAAATAAVSPR